MSKSVKFNAVVVEQSFGGTETPAYIKNISNGFLPPPIPDKDRTPKKPPNSTNKQNISSKFPFAEYKSPSPGVNNKRRYTFEDSATTSTTPECFSQVTFGTPMTPKQRWSVGVGEGEFTAAQDSMSITVAIRVRPFSQRELSKPELKNVVQIVDNETTITTERGECHRFTYDYSFWSVDQTGSYADQTMVYHYLGQPLLNKAFEGYNTCLFAYGQTGSGKSYSMMGQENVPNEEGIIPRFCYELFDRVNLRLEHDKEISFNVEISYFEIYNEKIHDLLCPSTKDKMGKKPSLKVREHPVLGPYVEGLSSHGTKSYDDIKGWLSVGNKHRATAATGMNDKSSRSHSVFSIILTQTKSDTIEGEVHEHAITSKINLVDLAGSERQGSARTSEDRLREGASINKSLHTLGKVISTLSEQSTASAKKKKLFVPYRDSVLTWLLKESLGGNSKTTMLATVSPALLHAEESLSTLRYAHQARSIVNMVRVNEDPKARLIRDLKSEIERLRSVMGDEATSNTVVSLSEVTALKEQLAMKEKEMQEMTRSWQERFKKSEEKRKEEAQLLERSGIALRVDPSLPHLVNLNEDPQLSETLLYTLRPGLTRVGRTQDPSKAEIQLMGPMIAEQHCIIENVNGKVTIEPKGDAYTYVNGSPLADTTPLHHGDRVILGGHHFFRFVNPSEARPKQAQLPGMSQIPRDYEYARQELERKHNERLEQELEAARKIHEKELEQHNQQAKKQLDKAREEADKKLSAQRTEYERRMEQLRKQVEEQRSQRLQSQEHKVQAEETISKLEEEKKMLAGKVARIEKQLCADAELQKLATPTASNRLVDLLSRESQRICDEVVRLKESLRARQTNRTGAKSNQCMVWLRVKEASRISVFLKKKTVFALEQKLLPGQSEPQMIIKVIQSDLGVATFWTLQKFEDQLIKMRELFEGEDSTHNIDEVFFDPNDNWEKLECVTEESSLSPKMVHSLRKQDNRLVSESIPFSMDKIDEEEVRQTGNGGVGRGEMLGQITAFFRNSMTAALESSPETSNYNFSDWILRDAQQMVVTMTHFQTAIKNSDQVKTVEVYTWLHQLHSCTHSLQLVSQLWSKQYAAVESSTVQELFSNLTSASCKVSTQLALFIQGYEGNIDSMVHESTSQIFTCLSSLVQCSGELALTTSSSMSALASQPQVPDVRHDFVKGCDRFVDKTLHGGLKTLEDCELKVMTLGDDTVKLKERIGNILKQAVLCVSSSRVFISKLQLTQVQLDSTISSTDSMVVPMERPSAEFFQQSYERCQTLVQEVSQLADGITVLTQTTEQLVEGAPDAHIKRLLRCTELSYRSVSKLTNLPDNSTCIQLQSKDTRSSGSSGELLHFAGQEAKAALTSLGTVVAREIESVTKTSPSKSKRILPLSPSMAANIGDSSGFKAVKKHASHKRIFDLADAT